MTLRYGPIVVFDGVCNLCNGLVRFVAANDPAGRFHFATLQSPEGQSLLAATGGAPQADSVVLFDYGRRYERSDAALYLALGLRQPWPLAFAFILIPRALRDAAYEWVARNRYRWFGRQATCPLPSPALRARFLQATVDDEASA
jgi:predicted DCC family thiol-disulfide oxidoreductase YuxK